MSPVPKSSGGKPDLSGVWLVADNTYFMSLTGDAKEDAVPYQSWAKAVVDQHVAPQHKDDPLALCLPPGVPRVNTNVFHPFKNHSDAARSNYAV